MFERDTSGRWTQTGYLKARFPDRYDAFGTSVSVSADGKTVIVGAIGNDSASGTVNFNETDNSMMQAGAAYIYQSPADLSLTLSPKYPSLEQYSTEPLDATIVNNATDVTANNVVLSFKIPAGLSYIGGNAGNGTCSQSGQTATCTLTSLAPGAAWQPTVLATAEKTGTVTGTATVTSNAPDPATAGNTASASVTVTAYPKTTGNTGGSNSGGGASTPLGLLALTLLLGLAGLRRQALKRNR